MARAGADEGIKSRYGTTVGLIGTDGLASREELLAYVRPHTGTAVEADLFPAVAFGAETFGIGESADVPPLGRLLLAMTVVLVTPTVLLVVIVSRAGLVERQRQSLVLELLGAGRRERWGWAWGAVGRPWLVGMAVGAVVVGLVMVQDVPLPGRNFVVQAADVRRSAGLVVALAVLAGAAVLFATVVAGRPRPAAHTVRPRAQLPTWPAWAALICVLAAPVATAALWLSGRAGTFLPLVVYFAAVVATLWSLPNLVGRITVGAADHLRRSGREHGDPARLVAAGNLRHDARAVVRYTAVLAITMISVVQVNGYLMLMSDNARQASAVRAALDNRFAQIDATPSAATQWVRVTEALEEDPDLAVVMISSRYDNKGEAAVTLYGDPSALAAFGIDQGPGPLTLNTVAGPGGQALAYVAGAPEVQVEPVDGAPVVAAEPADDPPTVTALVTTRSGVTVPLGDIKQAVAAEVAPMWRVYYPGDLWFLGALLSQDQASWAGWFGAIGATLLALAIIGSAADDVRRTASRVAPLAVLVSRPGVYRRIVAWRLGVPILVAVTVGGLISLMLRSALTSGSGALPSAVPAVVAMVAGVLAVAVALWLVTVISVARGADRWTGRSSR